MKRGISSIYEANLECLMQNNFVGDQLNYMK
nr:hypothetical protein [Clostridium ragsdalei]